MTAVKVAFSYKLDAKSVPGRIVVRLIGCALHPDGRPYDWKEQGPKATSEGPILAEHEIQVPADGALQKASPEKMAKALIERHGMKPVVEERLSETLAALGLQEGERRSIRMDTAERIDL